MLKNFSLNKFKILSGSVLKLIAVLSMLIDHTALLLHSEIAMLETPLFAIGSTEITLYYLMRKFGRLAFPIFCFLVTEGCLHTKNFKKYSLSLLIFAAISEIPYNFMLSRSIFFPAKQNIYFTLFLGVLLIYIFEKTKSEIKKVFFMFAIFVIAMFSNVDYGLRGTLLILLIYVLRNHATAQAMLSYPLLSGGFSALAAFIPINMYNGQRGFIKSGILKYSFYVFYPLHIIVLIIIKLILR